MVLNDYGHETSEHICDACGKVFTVMPGPDDGESGEDFDKRWGGCCLGEGCPSYDESRDIDKVWEGVQAFVVREPLP